MTLFTYTIYKSMSCLLNFYFPKIPFMDCIFAQAYVNLYSLPPAYMSFKIFSYNIP